MKAKLKFFLSYTLGWLLLFLLGKIVFLLYENAESFRFPLSDWLRILGHGLKMDLSATAYLAVLPLIILAVTSFLHWKIPYRLINAYTAVIIFFFLMVSLIDLEIYKYWGMRLDISAFRFISTPKENLASSPVWVLVLFPLLLAAASVMLYRLYKKSCAAFLVDADRTGVRGLVTFMLLTVAMLLPARGGVGVSVINAGTVYFHRESFANHAALNVVWNFGHSVIEQRAYENPYIFFPEGDPEGRLEDLYFSGDSTVKVLRTRRPDIILIILESFSAKLVEVTGGADNVTPSLNALAGQGILFDHIYASDSRTDKGLATILSGYPVLEAIPILKFAEKTQHLPYLSKSLKEAGYHATFYYGGEVDFANMRSYLVNGQFDRIIAEDDFPPSYTAGKWGIPDHKMFESFLDGVLNDSGPSLNVLLTLSSHEPFDVPGIPKFGSETLEQKLFSSVFYTDSCLGRFIQQLKGSKNWDNTLLILVADHGTRLPDYSEMREPAKYHIPMLWLGGALARDTVIAKYGSQADLAETLLRQMDISTDDFMLGKDLLSPASRSFAFFSYRDGVGMLTDSAAISYNFNTRKLEESSGKVDESLVNYAKLYQQSVYQDYLNRGPDRH